MNNNKKGREGKEKDHWRTEGAQGKGWLAKKKKRKVFTTRRNALGREYEWPRIRKKKNKNHEKTRPVQEKPQRIRWAEAVGRDETKETAREADRREQLGSQMSPWKTGGVSRRRRHTGIIQTGFKRLRGKPAAVSANNPQKKKKKGKKP